MAELIKTALYNEHISLNAKMAPFGGFDMPIQYFGIIKEHEATRKSAAIFDTCHMGEFEVEGENAVEDLEKILSCPIADIEIGQCRYGFICNESGGVIDDQITYRISESKFFIVVNAGTQNSDFDWFKKHLSSSTKITNLSEKLAKIDIQGPDSVKITEKVLDETITDLKFYRFKNNSYKGKEIIVSRTGYTGEMGFEVYLPVELATELWNEAISLGATPAGLGCRDTLRLEMGFPLYGHELNENRNPAESGFTRAIGSEKKFIGSNIVLDDSKSKMKLCGLVLEGRQSAREENKVWKNDKGEEIGIVTSGSFSPSLQKAIAFAYINKDLCKIGNTVYVFNGRKALKASISEVPFYKEGTCRKAITNFI